MNWRLAAETMLEIERKCRPFHRPPSTGCLVTWRERVLVGMIQHPVHDDFPAIVLLSVTSKYVEPEYICAIRNADPGRLELQADAELDLFDNYHVLRREGSRLTRMDPAETAAMERFPLHIIAVDPDDQMRTSVHIRTAERIAGEN